MNDFSEVRHGLELVRDAYRSPAGARLLDFLDGVHPGLRARARERFEAIAATIRTSTYITCLSEHDRAEDHVGRLSMWRAYSQACGVALVLNARPLLGRGSTAVGVNAGPVEYADRKTFLAGFDAFVEQMLAERDYIAELGPDAASRDLAGSYYYAALSTKHPGFAEEREWRVVFNPTLDAADHLVRSVEVCRNEPQVIYKAAAAQRAGGGHRRHGAARHPRGADHRAERQPAGRARRLRPAPVGRRRLRSGAAGADVRHPGALKPPFEAPSRLRSESPPPMLPRSGRGAAGQAVPEAAA